MPSGCPVTPGFPIRRSPDQSSFDSSPRLIAACHVLHRLSTPRHPPCALSSLATFMRGCRPATTSFRTRSRTSASCTGQTDFQRLRLPFDSPTSIKKIAPPNRLEYCDSFPQINRSADQSPRDRKDQISQQPTDLRPSLQLPKIVPATVRSKIAPIDGSPTMYPNPQRRQAGRPGFFDPGSPIRLNTSTTERNLP